MPASRYSQVPAETNTKPVQATEQRRVKPLRIWLSMGFLSLKCCWRHLRLQEGADLAKGNGAFALCVLIDRASAHALCDSFSPGVFPI